MFYRFSNFVFKGSRLVG